MKTKMKTKTKKVYSEETVAMIDIFLFESS